MDLALLDTDTLSEVFKGRNSLVAHRAAEYLRHQTEFAFSAITRYELLRGLREKNASAQIDQFDALCRRSLVLPLTEATFNCAVDLWVAARSGGHAHRDADILIAATAIEHQRVLVTGNTRHFTHMAGLRHDDWRKP